MSDAPNLWIDEQLVERIRRHGAETYPNECCGALLGRDADAESEPATLVRRVLGLFPLVNRREDSPCNRFSVSGEDVREADKVARSEGLDVIGWYHSHPDHPARPSEYDREHAWPWYSYIIVSVLDGKPQDLSSWRLQDDRSVFAAETVVIRRQAEA
jgi:proteasome lid subunit RPN8/RPN11